MKQRVIRGGMITSACQVILFILGIATTVVLARLLTPEHFGLIGMVTALTVLIERFQDIGLGDAIIQSKEITHKQISTLFWINLGICLFVTVLVAASAKIVAWFYNDQRLIWITIAFSSNFICSGLSIQHQALIRRQMRFDQQASIKIFSATFSLVIGITMACREYGYWALVWKELARSFISTILAWSFCRWRPGLPVRDAGVRSLLKFGGGITGYNVLFYLTNNLDSILLGKFYGAVPVGLYSRARQLTAVPLNQLLEPTKNVALPALSTLQDDSANYSNYYLKMLSVLTFIYMPIIVYIGIYANPIVNVALGSQWMDAVPVFRLFAISLFASPIVTMYGLIMLSLGYVRRYFYWGLFTSLSTIVAFVVGIRWGVLGIAASWSVSTTINLIFSLFYVFKGSPVNMVSTFKILYKPAIASTVMGCTLLLTYSFLLSYRVASQIMLSTLVGGGVYLLTWLSFPGGFKSVADFISYPLSALKSK